MHHLIQVLLPIYDNKKIPFPIELFMTVRQELTEKFGGITTYTRSPATGLWKENEEKTVRDEIVIYEVMTKNIDTRWWKSYKRKLEDNFSQDEIVIRSMTIELF